MFYCLWPHFYIVKPDCQWTFYCSFISCKLFIIFLTPFIYCLFIEQYVYILSVGTCLCILTKIFLVYIYILCFSMSKWAYIAFPSVYSVLVSHRYTNANIGACIGNQLNFLHTTKQPNNMYEKIIFFNGRLYHFQKKLLTF